MFNRADVSLVANGVQRLTSTGIVDTDDVERPTDVIILATGFEATKYQASLEVTGKNGARLHDVWGGEPIAFLGMTVPGFPNFFMLYGPNTNGGWSIISTLERQAEAVVRAVKRIERSGKAIDTRPRVTRLYDRW